MAKVVRQYVLDIEMDDEQHPQIIAKFMIEFVEKTCNVRVKTTADGAHTCNVTEYYLKYPKDVGSEYRDSHCYNCGGEVEPKDICLVEELEGYGFCRTCAEDLKKGGY